MDEISSKATQDQYVAQAFEKAVASYRTTHKCSEEEARRAILLSTGKTDGKQYAIENIDKVAEIIGAFFSKK